MVSPASRRLLNTSCDSCDSVYCAGILPLSIIAWNLLAIARKPTLLSGLKAFCQPAVRVQTSSHAVGTSATHA